MVINRQRECDYKAAAQVCDADPFLKGNDVECKSLQHDIVKRAYRPQRFYGVMPSARPSNMRIVGYRPPIKCYKVRQTNGSMLKELWTPQLKSTKMVAASPSARHSAPTFVFPGLAQIQKAMKKAWRRTFEMPDHLLPVLLRMTYQTVTKKYPTQAGGEAGNYKSIRRRHLGLGPTCL